MSAVHLLNNKGEINEIKQLFRNPELNSDVEAKRTAVRRVVELMTAGVDTSVLFSDMIMACFTKDMVTKKLIYSYLVANSAAHSDVAILSINTLEKECKEDSPLVRGLALRSLASLRLPNILEYVLPILHTLLADLSPYVRRIAVLCTLEIYDQSPDEFFDNNFFDTCVTMLRDADSDVCLSALEVIEHVLAKEERERQLCELDRRPEPAVRHAPFTVQKPLLYLLLNRMGKLAEVHQIKVINCVLRYTPESEAEMFDIMNVLEEYLQSTNSGVVLACCHAFFHLTQNVPEVQQQVLQRLRYPLVACAASATQIESAYAALCHIKVLAHRQPDLFAGDYKSFFCRFHDPTYVKVVKMDLLSCIVTQSSSNAIVEELLAYAEDRVSAVSRSALDNLGRSTMRCPEIRGIVAEIFMDLLRNGSAKVRANALSALQSLLRQMQDAAASIRGFVDAALALQHMPHDAHSSEAKTALVWILGEYGEHIDDAPYLLEDLCSSVMTESPPFRRQALTAAVTLFFKRPPEMQALLGRLFQQLLGDFSNADVLDRAMLYYRLLRANPQQAFRAISQAKHSVTAFTEDHNTERIEKLFEEFDSVAVVLGYPAEIIDAAQDAASLGEADLSSSSSSSASSSSSLSSSADSPVTTSAAAAAGTLALNPRDGRPSDLQLSADVFLESNDFQQRWSSLRCTEMSTVQLSAGLTEEQLEDTLESKNVFTLASGEADGAHKLFLYAQAVGSDDDLFLMEMRYTPASGSATVTVKSNRSDVEAFLKHLAN